MAGPAPAMTPHMCSAVGSRPHRWRGRRKRTSGRAVDLSADARRVAVLGGRAKARKRRAHRSRATTYAERPALNRDW